MRDFIEPRDAREVAEAVVWAAAHEKRLEVRGAGSKAGIGRPSQSDATLSLAALRGVTMYEPEELVLSARSGTPLAEIESLTASEGQELAFEPMDYGPIFGEQDGRATIGGVLAANVSGPRRLRSGAARDHFLGVVAVSGRGETFKAGGRVVKNVTGYDLPKLMAGSWGTLAAQTDVTIKVLPKPETAATVLVLGLRDEEAVRAMSEGLGSAADVSGAAHLPSGPAARAPVPGVAGAGGPVTALRLEGFEPSVAARRDLLVSRLAPFGEVASLGPEETRVLWRFIRDAGPFSGASERPLWRISVPPTAGPAVVAQIGREFETEALYDWAGGLVWLVLPPSEDAGEPIVRRSLQALGGHATLIRATPAVRAAVPVFQPEPAALAALSQRVKQSFDPIGILNPGRMWASA